MESHRPSKLMNKLDYIQRVNSVQEEDTNGYSNLGSAINTNFVNRKWMIQVLSCAGFDTILVRLKCNTWLLISGKKIFMKMLSRWQHSHVITIRKINSRIKSESFQNEKLSEEKKRVQHQSPGSVKKITTFSPNLTPKMWVQIKKICLRRPKAFKLIA